MSFRYYKDLLPSGLRVVTVETPHLNTATLAVYVKVGSRHEEPRLNGVSHFLEHLFFRGSRRYPDTRRMNAAVEAVGGNLNAATTRDHGYYYTPVHPDGLAVGFDVLGDMLTRPRLTDLAVEREIILEEMLDEVDPRGRDIDVDNLAKRALFGRHPLGLKIAGTPRSVRAISRADLVAHFRRYYVSGNMVVTAAGRVQREQVLATVQRAFARIAPGPAAFEKPAPPLPAGPWFEHVAHDEAQTAVKVVFPGAPESHPDYPALLLLRRILDDGLSSRLPFEVVEERGLAYSVHASMEAYEDFGLFEVEASTAPPKAARVLRQIFTTLGRLASKGATRGELSRAKDRHRMFLDFAHDSPADLAGWFGGTEVFFPPESFEARCRQVEAVSHAMLREVARRTFNRSRVGVVAVGPARGARALRQAALAPSALW